MSGEITTINFHGDTLFAMRDEALVSVAVTPICGYLGVDAQKHRRRIEGDTILAEGVCWAVYPSAGGPQNTFSLRLDLVSSWLFSINDKLVAEGETRQKLLAYKRECAKVLHRHFFPEVAEPGTAKEPRPFLEWTIEEMRVRGAWIDRCRLTKGLAAARYMWDAIGALAIPPDLVEPIPPYQMPLDFGSQPDGRH